MGMKRDEALNVWLPIIQKGLKRCQNVKKPLIWQ